MVLVKDKRDDANQVPQQRSFGSLRIDAINIFLNKLIRVATVRKNLLNIHRNVSFFSISYIIHFKLGGLWFDTRSTNGEKEDFTKAEY